MCHKEFYIYIYIYLDFSDLPDPSDTGTSW